jgi:16S rRNA (guanine(1405)-N(7))-methyltransferase
MESDLEELVRLVKNSERYAEISTDLVRSIGLAELQKRRNLKEAVKATRSKLHQVGAAYQENAIPYFQLTAELKGLDPTLADPAVRRWLKSAMAYHASTRERLPILERIYTETLAPLGSIQSVLDIACGLNPLSLPWMPLAVGATYRAVDIYGDLIGFLNSFFDHFQVDGRAEVLDVLQTPQLQPVQVALLMKTIPCLEQVDKLAGRKLLESIQAETMLVSFPARSLGGRSKGMLQNYEAHFRELTAGKPWQMERFQFEGELVFRVQKS